MLFPKAEFVVISVVNKSKHSRTLSTIGDVFSSCFFVGKIEKRAFDEFLIEKTLFAFQIDGPLIDNATKWKARVF